jgi:hypothetical protein
MFILIIDTANFLALSKMSLLPPSDLAESSVGPFYSPEVDYTTNFSDGLFDCFADINSCILCCFPFLWPALYSEVNKDLPSPYFFGIENRNHAVIAFLVIVLLSYTPFGVVLQFLSAWIVADLTFSVMKKHRIIMKQRTSVYVEAFFCRGCLLSQVYRHTARATGWLPGKNGHNIQMETRPMAAPEQQRFNEYTSVVV